MKPMTRTLFSRGLFESQAFRPQLGLTFSDLRTEWDQYAPTVRTDLKDVRNEIAPAAAAPVTTVPMAANQQAPAAAASTVTSPTNLIPGPALQPKSNLPIILAVLIGLSALGGGGYYLYSHGYLGKKFGKKK